MMRENYIYSLFLVVVLIGFSVFTFKTLRVGAQLQTVYIRINGDVEPSWVPIQRNGDFYTFTEDILVDGDVTGMIIERDDMTLDGASHSFSRSPSLVNVNGIELTGRSNVTIMNMTIKQFYYGIMLHSSSSNTISENNITNNSYDGICLEQSHHNIISGNRVTNNIVNVYLYQSSNNTILGNNITNANTCVYIRRESSNNTVSQNNITYANYIGVRLHGSYNNTIYENYIANNNLNGIQIDTSGNKVYHNNFVGNANQAQVTTGNVNIWDDGYPSGGNYWSDYEERYPNATELDGSGI